MKFKPYQQQGAVLAFSLVMLLLLTLVSISMIQQNKVQTAITSNSRVQTQAFSTVEGALSIAQDVLKPKRYSNEVGHKCKTGVNPNAVNEGDILNLGISSIAARITAVYCLVDYDTTVNWGTERQCTYTGGVRDSNQACDLLNRAGQYDDDGHLFGGCPVEVYTLNLTINDTSKGTQRTIESKFEVDCTGVPTPP